MQVFSKRRKSVQKLLSALLKNTIADRTIQFSKTEDEPIQTDLLYLSSDQDITSQFPLSDQYLTEDDEAQQGDIELVRSLSKQTVRYSPSQNPKLWHWYDRTISAHDNKI